MRKFWIVITCVVFMLIAATYGYVSWNDSSAVNEEFTEKYRRVTAKWAVNRDSVLVEIEVPCDHETSEDSWDGYFSAGSSGRVSIYNKRIRSDETPKLIAERLLNFFCPDLAHSKRVEPPLPECHGPHDCRLRVVGENVVDGKVSDKSHLYAVDVTVLARGRSAMVFIIEEDGPERRVGTYRWLKELDERIENVRIIRP